MLCGFSVGLGAVWSDEGVFGEFAGFGSCCASAGKLTRTSHTPAQATRLAIAVRILNFPATQFPAPLNGIDYSG
jgi:hypothetical protein